MNRTYDNLVRNERGLLIGYTCKLCNGYNDITRHGSCIYCQVYQNINLDDFVLNLSYAIRYWRTGEMIMMRHEEVIELHTKFFNAEKVAIRDLDEVQKTERRELLRLIIVEAKAKLSAHDEDEREKNAKLAKDKKDWLLSSSSNDPLVTDAIATVKERKKRMSEADKLHAKLSSIGVSGKELDEIVASAIRKNTGSSISSSFSRPMQDNRPHPMSENCRRNLHKGCSGTREDEKPCECKCHKPKVVVDLSKLNFKPKQ